jgi:phosphoglycerol transferase MdoB-like AlkP superfamily enzyme
MSKVSAAFQISLFFLLCIISFLSYFGRINPHTLGLLSDISVFFFGFAFALFIIPFGKKIFVLYFIALVILCVFLVVSSWWYFQYFQSYYNYSSLGFRADLFEVSKAFSSFMYKQEAGYFVFLTALFSVFVVVFYQEPLKSKRYYFLASTFTFSLAAVCWAVVEISLVHYKNLNIAVLQPAYLHPVHAFFTGSDKNRDISALEYVALEQFSDLNSMVEGGELVSLKAKPYNVIYIVLESTRASLVGAYGNKDGLTPNIDALSLSLVVSKSFYANSNYTIKGEVASWCGIFDSNAKPPISKSSDSIKNLQCLPKILVERGYDTSYFHGNTSAFNSRKEFLPIVGFEHLYFPEDDAGAGSLPKIGWGISDGYMYKFMLDNLLAQNDKPFFAHFMTVSSHYPYGWDWGIPVPLTEHPDPKNASEVYENYKNAVFYEDYELGKFWNTFKKSKLYDNTIVLITADHGVWVFDDEDKKSLLQKNEEFFRIPLLIYHPDINEPMELTDTASQIDLPETVLNMLGIKDYDDYFVGKNLFEMVENPWAIMMKQGDIVVRKNDTICYVEGSDCAGIQQDCVAIEYGELLPDINKLLRCQKVEGDLLRESGATISDVPSDPELMDKAFSLIRYHNKKVFLD